MAQLVKNPLAVNLGLILGLGRSPGGGKGYLLQHSGLENSMDFIVHGVAKSTVPEAVMDGEQAFPTPKNMKKVQDFVGV